jgi:peptidoglycan/LPS O-acetylase OafA/YrhL
MVETIGDYQEGDMSRSGETKGLERPTDQHILFFDAVRNLAMLSVVFYHAVAAYSTVTPHWSVHDGSSATADMVREFFDVFMMPAFFFLAGYFTLPSLSRQGVWKFLLGKFKRIGVPWLLAIFVIIPMSLYFTRVKYNTDLVHQSFWHSWMTYLSDFGTLRIGLLSMGRTNQMHFWFLSLLLAFFLVFVLLHVLSGKVAGSSGASAIRKPASYGSILWALLVTAALTSLASFVAIRLTPYLSWLTVDLLLQFQPINLALYIASFYLGVSAYSRQWFAGDRFPRRLSLWIPVGILLTLGFFLVGQDVFIHHQDSRQLLPGLLLGFSAIRSSLCLALLVIFIACARRFWNRSSRLNQKLSANSYNIYLVHIFFVVFLQDVLMIWPRGPSMAKAAIVFLLVLPISYGISRVIDRFPRGFVIFLLSLFILAIVATH